MHINQLTESRFLKKEDCGPQGILVTIKTISQENVAKEGVPEELRWAICFEELEKPMVLNSTNIQLCEQVFKSDDTDDWQGKRIVLYTDPNVSFQGKLVGGIRVRAPKATTAPAKPKPAPVSVEELDDDAIPF